MVPEYLQVNWEKVQERIVRAAAKSGRKSSSIKLVAVTKTISPQVVQQIIELGATDLGENRVQEAQKKISLLGKKNINWHLIGHLQTNKAKLAVKMFDLIHSVDSLKLAQELNKQAEKIKKQVEILIQVNTSREEQKFGVSPAKTIELVREIASFPYLKIKGLMTMAPFTDNERVLRKCFSALRAIKEKITEERITSVEMKYLSMGMSQDFEIAIEEGANIIRLGRVLFEERSPGS